VRPDYLKSLPSSGLLLEGLIQVAKGPSRQVLAALLSRCPDFPAEAPTLAGQLACLFPEQADEIEEVLRVRGPGL
jgi:hypothetical protein